MKQMRFFVCPVCGNLTFSSGGAAVSCCGRPLEPLTPQKAAPEEALRVTESDGDWYVESNHPASKDNYISFVALVTGGDAAGTAAVSGVGPPRPHPRPAPRKAGVVLHYPGSFLPAGVKENPSTKCGGVFLYSGHWNGSAFAAVQGLQCINARHAPARLPLADGLIRHMEPRRQLPLAHSPGFAALGDQFSCLFCVHGVLLACWFRS